MYGHVWNAQITLLKDYFSLPFDILSYCTNLVIYHLDIYKKVTQKDHLTYTN